MAHLNILSLNCHGFNLGTLQYLKDKCYEYDILLLQETWLSKESCKKLDDISPDFSVIHTSAIENKIHDDYLSGRPYGGTAVLYNKRLCCTVTKIDTNNSRCTAVKLSLNKTSDLVICSVYMPYFIGSLENRLEYENTVGCLQGIVDKNIGCNFVFGGDMNVSKLQQNTFYKAVDNFCSVNGFLWLDPVDGSIDYTYHNEKNGHYKLLDHIIASPCLVESHKAVSILAEDDNTSDHYGISFVCNIDTVPVTKVKKDNSQSRLKYQWQNADLEVYQKYLSKELSSIILPITALCCNGTCNNHCIEINTYYQNIVQSITTAANNCVPVKKLGVQKSWWTEELDQLKQETIDATNFWRSAGCPRSGPVNNNRLQCKYRYKMAIKSAMNSADKAFNDDLFDYFCSKDDVSFWRAWRKRYCSTSVKTANVVNGKHGDTEICAEFTEHFQSVFKTNTPNSDKQYESELHELLKSKTNDEKDGATPLVDFDLCQRALRKMKLNKSPGFDNISAEHLVYGGPTLYIHMCLLFNAMMQHCYVPQDFGLSLIVPLPKDKHGDIRNTDMYRGISLSPMMAKLFEYTLLEIYEDQLSSDPLQFGFKKHSGCCHALFTFKNVTKYFIKKGSKVYCAFLDASKAFDKVLHNGLFVKLLKKGTSVRFVRILQNWYSKLCAAVQWNGVTGKVFDIHCGVRQGGILSPMLFCIYMDDLIKELRLSGFGTYLSNLFIGSILYADDICLISHSCFGLQKMLDICHNYGVRWDILFNPVKSHLITFGGSIPKATLRLNNDYLQWSSKVKYLGLYLIGGVNFRINLNMAKQKYFGCFNNIKSIVGQQVNEIMILKLIKTYCLPRLLYGCEMWPIESVDMYELDVIWNNGFRHIFNCCWRCIVKPLQFFCQSMPLSFVIEKRQLMFFS